MNELELDGDWGNRKTRAISKLSRADRRPRPLNPPRTGPAPDPPSTLRIWPQVYLVTIRVDAVCVRAREASCFSTFPARYSAAVASRSFSLSNIVSGQTEPRQALQPEGERRLPERMKIRFQVSRVSLWYVTYSNIHIFLYFNIFISLLKAVCCLGAKWYSELLWLLDRTGFDMSYTILNRFWTCPNHIWVKFNLINFWGIISSYRFLRIFGSESDFDWNCNCFECYLIISTKNKNRQNSIVN